VGNARPPGRIGECCVAATDRPIVRNGGSEGAEIEGTEIEGAAGCQEKQACSKFQEEIAFWGR
jgi:hypothetical protein